jgi:hypothetical protein
MYIVRRQFRGCIIEHDYCNQSQALAIAYTAERTESWTSIMVIDTETEEVIYEGGTPETNKVKHAKAI